MIYFRTCVLPALLLATATAAIAAEPVVTTTLADWKWRLIKVKSARYVVEGTTEDLIHAAGRKQPLKMTILLDLEKRRVRIVREGLIGFGADTPDPPFDAPFVRFVPSTDHKLFDGRVMHHFGARGGELDGPVHRVFQYKGNLSQHVLHQEMWPILIGHGIVPLVRKMARPDKWPADHDPETLYDRGATTLSGRTCAVIGSVPPNEVVTLWDELFVDRDRQSAVLRLVNHVKKQPSIRLDTTYAEGPAGWMPAKWTYAQHRNDGQLVRSDIMTVTAAEFDVPVADADFTVVLHPGDELTVAEYAQPGLGVSTQSPALTTSIIGEHGLRTTISETGFKTPEGKELPPNKPTWFYWLIPLPLLIGIAWVLWRRRRKYSTTS